MSVESASGEAITTDTPRAIAKDAYLYAFSMLENYQTMYKQAADRQAPEYIGGFGHYRTTPSRSRPTTTTSSRRTTTRRTRGPGWT